MKKLIYIILIIVAFSCQKKHESNPIELKAIEGIYTLNAFIFGNNVEFVGYDVIFEFNNNKLDITSYNSLKYDYSVDDSLIWIRNGLVTLKYSCDSSIRRTENYLHTYLATIKRFEPTIDGVNLCDNNNTKISLVSVCN